MKKNIAAISIVLGFIVFISIALITRLFNSSDLPTQISGALLEAVVTAIITYFLLTGQTSQEKEREKDVRIFEEKVKVYSEFSQKLWGMITDDNEVSTVELIELRKLCFSKLVFYLNDSQIQSIAQEIKGIKTDANLSIGKISIITQILQENLQSDSISLEKTKKSNSAKYKDKNKLVKDRNQLLSDLFTSFNREGQEVNETQDEVIVLEDNNSIPIQYWHFNLLGDEQLNAFDQNNWILALIEYGEEWRTNLVKQVKPNDVIFLFRRGGYGYIGAFKALDPANEILQYSDYEKYDENKITKYDIYNGLEDGATLCSNLLVEPIAYNPLGVGAWSVRRRTIERINDPDAVMFLLNRFNGKGQDREGNLLSENQLKCFNKLRVESTSVLKTDRDYLKKILLNYNLS